MVVFDPSKIILFQDEAILVVNKPNGLLSIQDGYDKTLPYLSTVLEPKYGTIWMVHRLDRDTSGVLVMARNPEAHRDLNHQFQSRQVVKTYHALIIGSPPWKTHRVNQPLRLNGDRRHRTVVDANHGKSAITDISLLEQFNKYALVEAHPFTGYTHQIRAHLASSGFPIAVDPLYGNGLPIYDVQTSKENNSPQALLTRLGLHAYSLSFSHPISFEKLTFQAEYPDDFIMTLNYLRSLLQQ